MENSFQTSFIPKKTTSTSTATVKGPKGFLFILSILILVVTIVVAGGAFFYKSYLKKQEISLSQSLSKTRGGFEKDTIDELELFNKRIEIASLLLKNHTTSSAIFSMLGDVTIPSVQYVSFSFQYANNGFNVILKGLAKDYRSIALQSDPFNTTKGKVFKNVLFSDLTRDKNNNVSFNLKFEVDPSVLSYEKNVLNTKKEIKEEILPEQKTPDTQMKEVSEPTADTNPKPLSTEPKKIQ